MYGLIKYVITPFQTPNTDYFISLLYVNSILVEMLWEKCNKISEFRF